MNDEEVSSLLERIDTIEKVEIAEAMYELGQANNIAAGIKLGKKRDEIQSNNSLAIKKRAIENKIPALITRVVVWLLETTNSKAIVKDSDFDSDFDSQIMEFLGLKGGWGCIDEETDTIMYEAESGLLNTLFGGVFENAKFKLGDYSFDSDRTILSSDDIVEIYLILKDNMILDNNNPVTVLIESTLEVLDNFWVHRNGEYFPVDVSIGLVKAALLRGDEIPFDDFKSAVAAANLSGTGSGSLDAIYELIE